MGISENIKLIRRRYDLTQAELGKIAGVSDKAVSTWENGTKEPRMGAIQKIADHFNLSKSNIIEKDGMDCLLGNKDISAVREECFTCSADSTEKELYSLVGKLNQEGKEKVLEYAKDLQGTGRYKKNNKACVV